MAKPKRISKVEQMKVPLEIIEALNTFYTTAQWHALKEVMKLYIEERKKVAFHLDERNPYFGINHAKESSQAVGFNFLIDFIEKEIRRESQE